MIAVPDLYKEKRRQVMRRDFDLLSLGEILLRLSPPDNERIEMCIRDRHTAV